MEFLLAISIILFLIGLALWVKGHRESTQSVIIQGLVPKEEFEMSDDKLNNFKRELTRFKQDFPDLLPGLLSDMFPKEYAGIMDEIRDRIRLKIEQGSISERTKLLQRFNELQKQYLEYYKIGLEARGVKDQLDRADLESQAARLKIEKETKQLEFEIAEIDKKIKDIKEPEKPRKTFVEYISEEFRNKVHTKIELDRTVKELIKENPDQEELIKRLAEDYEGRILEKTR